MKQPLHSNRIPEADLLRTAAFAAVVAQHVLGAWLRRPGVTPQEQAVIGLLFGLTKFAVPMFLFLSGAVLFLRYHGRLRYGRFLCRRLRTVIVPYLCWAVFYYLYTLLDTGAPPCGKWEYLRQILTCSISYHTWYVGTIVQFYLFLPLIFALFDRLAALCRSPQSAVLTISAVMLLWLLLIEAAPLFRSIPGMDWLMYDQRAKNGIYYLGYFLLGGIFGLHREAFCRVLRRAFPAILAVAVLSYVWSEWVLFQKGFVNGQLNLNWMGTLNTRMTICCVSSILVLCRAAQWLHQPRLRTVCRFVGDHSYSAYLAHAMAINICSDWLLHWQGLALPVFYALLLIMVPLLSVGTGWIFDLVQHRCWRTAEQLCGASKN